MRAQSSRPRSCITRGLNSPAPRLMIFRGSRSGLVRAPVATIHAPADRAANTSNAAVGTDHVQSFTGASHRGVHQSRYERQSATGCHRSPSNRFMADHSANRTPKRPADTRPLAIQIFFSIVILVPLPGLHLLPSPAVNPRNRYGPTGCALSPSSKNRSVAPQPRRTPPVSRLSRRGGGSRAERDRRAAAVPSR